MGTPAPATVKGRFIPQPHYFLCRRVLMRLERMQNLIRLREPWERDLARPDPAVPETDIHGREIALAREINRLIPLIVHHLDLAGISTEAVGQDWDEHFDGQQMTRRQVERDWNVFEDYFELSARSDSYQLQMQALERGIGWYSVRKERAFWELFSPISWIAFVIQIPIKALERAGVPMEDASSKGVLGIAWVLRLSMLTLLGLACAKLGLSIPWDKIAALFK